MKHRLVLIVAIALALAIGLVIALRGGASGDAGLGLDIADPGHRAQPAAAPADATTPVDAAASRVGRSEVERAAPAPATAPGRFAPDALYGVVKWREGGVVAGATVAVFGTGDLAIGPDEAPAATAVTGVDGRFRFEAQVPFQVHRLQVEAEGHVPGWFRLQPGRDHELTIARGFPVSGVVDEGTDKRPVADARVFVAGERWTRPLEVRTAPNGSYRFAALATDRDLRFGVVRAGGVAEWRELKAGEAKERRFDIHLGAGCTLRGEIFDAETNQPVANATVMVDPRTPAVRADARGGFTLAASGDTGLQMIVEASGYAPMNCRVKKVDPAQPIRVGMLKCLTIDGRVRERGGAPVAGAQVRVQVGDMPFGRAHGGVPLSERSFGSGQISPQDWARIQQGEREAAGNRRPLLPRLPDGCWIDERPWPPVRTDAQGAFSLTGFGVRAGLAHAQVSATLPGYCETRSDALTLPFPGGRATCELVMARAATLSGTVRMAGRPVRANLNLRAPGLRLTAQTNDGGDYRFDGLPPGDAAVTLVVEQTEFARASATIAIREGEAARRDFDLDVRLATITGRVKDHDGQPVRDVIVRAIAEAARRDRQRPRAEGKTDPGGAFVLTVPADAGTFTVHVVRSPVSQNRRGIAPDTDAGEFVLPEVGRLDLAVVDGEEGTAIAEFELRWRARGESEWRWADTSRREDGKAAVTQARLPVGAVDLEVDANASAYRTRRLEGIVVRAASDAAPMRVDLERKPSIVLVPGGDAAVMAGHTVFLVPVEAASVPLGGNRTLADLLRELAQEGDDEHMLRDGVEIRRVRTDRQNQIAVAGPGTQRLQSVPDDLLFDPPEIVVPPRARGLRIPVTWRKKE